MFNFLEKSALSHVLAKTDRILTDLPVTVKVHDGVWRSTDKAPPSYVIGYDISIANKVVEEYKMSSNTDSEFMASVLGLNYHELCHVLYTPGVETRMRTWAQVAQLFRSFNALEDQRIENLFCAEYSNAHRYFTWTILRHVVPKDRPGNAFPLTHGRKYLPRKVRLAVEKEFSGSARIKRELKAVIDEYIEIVDFDEDLERAKDLVISYSKLVKEWNKELIQNGDMLPDNKDCGSDCEHEGQQHRDKHRSEKEKHEHNKQVKENNRRAQRARKDQEEAEKEDEEISSGEGEGSESESESETEDKSEGGNSEEISEDESEDESEGSGDDSGESEDGESSDDPSGSSESDADGSDEGSEGEGSGKGENPSQGGSEEGNEEGVGTSDSGEKIEAPDWEEPELPEDASEEIQKAVEEILSNESFQREVRSTNESFKSQRRMFNESTSENGDKLLPITPEMKSERDRAKLEIGKLMEDIAPTWHYGAESGVLNVGRYLNSEHGDEDIWDRWDEGKEADVGCEVFFTIDVSGSMGMQYVPGSRIDCACQALWIMKSAFDELGVRTVVTSFGDPTNERMIYGHSDRVKPDQYLFLPATHPSTIPQGAIDIATLVMKESDKRNKLFIALTDGRWPAGGGAHGGLPSWYDQLDALGKMGVKRMLISVGLWVEMDPNDPDGYMANYFDVIHNAPDASSLVGLGSHVRDLVIRTMQTSM